MKKILLKQLRALCITMLVIMSFLLIQGCKAEPHWSYQACIDKLIGNGWAEYAYSYTVKEINHDEVVNGDDEVHCFDITITSGTQTTRWCCFVVLNDNEIIYTDCDWWEEN